ncbi:hypothetical protein WAA16_11985 [Bacillus pumilus]|uniref:hypothetical protein n=1 Tax=Bacillus pumilus TaxID=1408 RepID=UPI0030CDAE7D
MNWLEFWSRLIDSIIWPAAIIIIVFALRGSVKKIIEGRLFSFKVGNVEVVFDKLLEEVNESLNEGNISLENEESFSNKDISMTKTTEEIKAERKKARAVAREEDEEIYRIISVNAEEAMRRSWRLVGRELVILAKKYNDGIALFEDNLYSLVRKEVISRSTFRAILKLLQITSLMKPSSRNGYEWTEEDALSFHRSCRGILTELRKN